MYPRKIVKRARMIPILPYPACIAPCTKTKIRKSMLKMILWYILKKSDLNEENK